MHDAKYVANLTIRFPHDEQIMDKKSRRSRVWIFIVEFMAAKVNKWLYEKRMRVKRCKVRAVKIWCDLGPYRVNTLGTGLV